jgi:PHD/YefM family antitoxin component YafN of YafNO toxin-antitoxin module
MVYALVVAVPEVLSFREFRAGLAGVLDRVRRSPDAAVFVGGHRRAEAVLMSVEQYEALQEAAERQHAVAAALASVRTEGLEPSAEDLALFAEVAAGRLSTDELREWVLSRWSQVSNAAGDPWAGMRCRMVIFSVPMRMSLTSSRHFLAFFGAGGAGAAAEPGEEAFDVVGGLEVGVAIGSLGVEGVDLPAEVFARETVPGLETISAFRRSSASADSDHPRFPPWNGHPARDIRGLEVNVQVPLAP